MERVDCVVVGAGVIGLAIAREMALQGRETILLERESTFGTVSSARNSRHHARREGRPAGGR